MDTPNSSLSQEKEGDQQISELPTLNDKGNSQEASDHVYLSVRDTSGLECYL